jgi:hypothetical protein
LIIPGPVFFSDPLGTLPP